MRLLPIFECIDATGCAYTNVGGYASKNGVRMSLHFQIDLAFDIQNKETDVLVDGLIKLTRNENLGTEQKKLIPKIFKFVSSTEMSNSFHGRSIFYINNHYRYTKDKVDVSKWTFHFRQVFNDDLFYEEGYPLIAWLATISETEGFIGYIKEEFSESPKLIYFRDGIVKLVEKKKDDITFKLSDFDLSQTIWKD